MRLFCAALLLCLAATSAEAARSQRHWGGPDFAISCDTVRAWRKQINAMSAQTKAEMARQFNITRKQRRQAYACLRGKR
jgi:hypothetical protein